MEKPTYTKRSGSDYAGQHYGEALHCYLPHVRNSKMEYDRWGLSFRYEKYHPIIDLYALYIKNDLKSIGMIEKKDFNFDDLITKDELTGPYFFIARLRHKNKVDLIIIIRRILFLKEFKKYIPFTLANLREFFAQPAYTGISFS